MSQSRSKWEDFFKGAGIPPKPASEYATMFCDNRMRHNMLEELNKEVLHELGVKAIGDVIAILRHAKSKQAEMLRGESPSSPEVEILKTSHPKKASEKQTKNMIKSSIAISSSSKSTAVNADQKQLKSLSMTVKADTKSSKSKQLRRTLSDRFCEYEKEAKQKKKDEEKKEIQTVKETPVQPSKAKQTVFTIQLPSKLPLISDQTPPFANSKSTEKKETKKKPAKVTLVPAQGKPLNRNKQSTSIFDRLDKTTSSKVQPSVPLTKTVAVLPKEKKGVFSRLGDMDSDSEISSESSSSQTTPMKTQEPAVISPLRQSAASSSSLSSGPSAKNVFSRLGGR